MDPIPVLLAEVIFSNIGGAATAVGDPPNVLIVNNKQMNDNGIDFTTFTTHMLVGIIAVSFVSYGALRFIYRNKNLEANDPPEVAGKFVSNLSTFFFFFLFCFSIILD